MPTAPTEYAVGVDLGGTNLKVALVERTEGIVRQAVLPTEADHGPERVLDRIVEGVTRVVTGFEAHGHVEGVGIGAPGIVSLDRSTVTKPPNFPGWGRSTSGTTSPRLARRRLDWPARHRENDANAAALGSAFYGSGQPFDSFVMVTLGTGVGGAIVVRQPAVSRRDGAAGEIGHMSIDYEGPYDRAGVAGRHRGLPRPALPLAPRALPAARARDASSTRRPGTTSRTSRRSASTSAALAGDPAAIEVLAWAGHKLGVPARIGRQPARHPQGDRRRRRVASGRPVAEPGARSDAARGDPVDVRRHRDRAGDAGQRRGNAGCGALGLRAHRRPRLSRGPTRTIPRRRPLGTGDPSRSHRPPCPGHKPRYGAARPSRPCRLGPWWHPQRRPTGRRAGHARRAGPTDPTGAAGSPRGGGRGRPATAGPLHRDRLAAHHAGGAQRTGRWPRRRGLAVRQRSDGVPGRPGIGGPRRLRDGARVAPRFRHAVGLGGDRHPAVPGRGGPVFGARGGLQPAHAEGPRDWRADGHRRRLPAGRHLEATGRARRVRPERGVHHVRARPPPLRARGGPHQGGGRGAGLHGAGAPQAARHPDATHSAVRVLPRGGGAAERAAQDRLWHRHELRRVPRRRLVLGHQRLPGRADPGAGRHPGVVQPGRSGSLQPALRVLGAVRPGLRARRDGRIHRPGLRAADADRAPVDPQPDLSRRASG